MKRALSFLFAALASACASDRERATVPADINAKFMDPALDPLTYIKRWEVESREIFVARQAIVDAIELRPGDRIADVGAGTGLFMLPFSRAVGSTGRVFALDISPRFIAHLRGRVRDRELRNVEVVMSKPDSTELPPGSVDCVFVCDTYHHFEDHAAMLRSIHAALRPDGRLIVIDFERIPGQTREWILGHVRAGKETFVREIESAGFRRIDEPKIDAFRENYLVRFARS